MFRASSLIAAAMSLSFAGMALAASTPPDNQAAVAYVRSKPMLETMYRLGVAEDRKLGLQSSCKSQYQVRPTATLVLSPIEFAEGKSDPVKGVWLSRYQLERCGDAKVYNALFSARDGQAPSSRPFFPGATNAGPVLVNDAMRAAVSTATTAGVPKDCKTAHVYDMRVTQPARDVTEQGTTLKGVWDEVWTFSMCGQLVDVPMTFIPDAKGGGTTFKGGKASVRSASGQ